MEAYEVIIADIRDWHGREAAGVVEAAGDEAWGALKDARQRGAAIEATHVWCVGEAGRLWEAGDRDIDAMAEEIVRRAGLTPVRDDCGLEAVR